MLSKRLSPILREFLKKAGPYLIAAMWAIMLWLVAVDVMEMAVTEWNYVYNSFPGVWRVWILTGFILLTVPLLTMWQRKTLSLRLWAFGISSLFFLMTLLGHQQYREYYRWLQRFPKLKSISATSSIQADRIEIIGKNFGDPSQIGNVSVGNLEFITVSWNDERVVIEQPVPSRYFVDDMILTNHYGNTLVIKSFSIKDPSEVWQ